MATDGFDESAINAFVAQPAYHADEDVDAPADRVATVAAHVPWRRRLTHLLFEKRPSGYSSIAPRRPDGSRTKLFFFNGGGRGR